MLKTVNKYIVRDWWNEAVIGVDTRADAEEFLLSVAEEGAFEDFCDNLINDDWTLEQYFKFKGSWRDKAVAQFGLSQVSDIGYVLWNYVYSWYIEEVPMLVEDTNED